MCDGVVVVVAAAAAADDDDDHGPYDVAADARVSLRTCLELGLLLQLKLLLSPPAMDTPKKQFAS